MNSARDNEPGVIKRTWRQLTSPSAKWSVLSLLVIGVIIGGGGVIATHVAVAKTGTTDFCGGACHSMNAFTLPEYKQSAHYSNASGVSATCADCHIPHAYPQKLFYKAKAGVRDIIQETRGVISTQEKYERERWRLANQVWTEFKETDSANCRHCHDANAMNSDQQKPAARKAHEMLKAGKATCIDCHKGIAHKEPEEPSQPQKTGAARDVNVSSNSPTQRPDQKNL